MALPFLSRNRDRTASSASSTRPGSSKSRPDGCIDSWARSKEQPGWVAEGWCTETAEPQPEVGSGASKRPGEIGWMLRYSRPDAARALGPGDPSAKPDRLGFILFVRDETAADASRSVSQLTLRFPGLALRTRTPALPSMSRAQGVFVQAWNQNDEVARAALGDVLEPELAAALAKAPPQPAETAPRRAPPTVHPDLWGSLDSWERICSRPGWLIEGWCRAVRPRVFLFSAGAVREARIEWILRFPRPDAAQILGQDGEGAELGFVLFVRDDRGPAVDRIVVEQGGAGRAQRDENPADAGRPQSAIAAAWHGRGHELIERFGRTPPPEMLAALARPPGELVQRIALHIDHLTGVRDLGVLIGGWLVDATAGSAQLVLVDETDGTWVDLSTGWSRIERADVMAEFEKRGAQPGSPPGFISLVRAPALALHAGPPDEPQPDEEEDEEPVETLPTGPLAIYGITGGGEVCGQRVRVKPAGKTADRIMRALNAVNGSAAAAASVIERHVGPAIDAWLHQDLARASIVRDDVFGDVPARPHTSIVVPVWGREDLIRVQLARMATDPGLRDGVELIYVVDDPRLTESIWQNARQWQIAYGLPFRVLASSGNAGYASALNFGSRAAKGTLLLALDSDCLPERPGWLGELSTTLLSDPQCGAAGPLLRFGDGTVQSAGYRLAQHPEVPAFRTVVDRGRGQLDHPVDCKQERVDAVSGACLLTRRELFLRVGGFEAGFLFGHHEDAIYCRRLAALGLHTLLLPGVHLHHLEGVSRQTRRSSEPLLADPIWRAKSGLYNAWHLSRRIAAAGVRE